MAESSLVQVKDGQSLLLQIPQKLDEGSSFPYDLPVSEFQTLILDLDGLTYLNSSGIKAWTQWMTYLADHFDGDRLRLRNCPSVFIEAANMVVSIMPASYVIESFRVPYYCENIDESHEITLYKGKDFDVGSDEKSSWWNVEELIQLNGESYGIDTDTRLYFQFLGKR